MYKEHPIMRVSGTTEHFIKLVHSILQTCIQNLQAARSFTMLYK